MIAKDLKTQLENSQYIVLEIKKLEQICESDSEFRDKVSKLLAIATED